MTMNDDARLEAVRGRLDALRAHDSGRLVFGVQGGAGWGHGYELGAALAEDRLAAFEREHGVSLPASYRAFLRHFGDGGAGPYYGLVPLEPLERGELPQNAVEVHLDGELVGRSATGPREVPSVVSSTGRPFPLTGSWSPEEGALPVAPGASPYDGCVRLAEQGCGYFDFLVVKGPRAGEVWSDYTAGDGPITKAHDDFLEWYEAWLDRAELEWIEKSAEPLALAREPHPGIAAYLAKLEAALDGAPERWADGWRALGYARLHLGKKDALAAFEHAASIGQQEPKARLLLDRARIAQREGRHDDALARIAEGLAEPEIWASTRTALFRARLAALDAAGREEQALAALRALADDAFWTLDHHHELARRLLRKGLTDQAVAVLDDAVQRDVGPDRGSVKATRDSVFGPLLADLEREGASADAAKLRAALAS